MFDSLKCEGKLLVVDKRAESRRLLHTTLFNMGFEIVEASSGEQALALCQIVPFDAVLLAINGQRRSRFDLCAELHRLLPGSAI